MAMPCAMYTLALSQPVVFAMSASFADTRRSFFRRFVASVFGGGLITGAAKASDVPEFRSRPVEPYLGEISMFAGNFAPRGWALCNGQLLSISQHSALFSLLGTFYGGDGRTTFALPDLRGRVPLGSGLGPGLPNFQTGQRGGAATTTLSGANLPSHTHAVTVAGASTPGDTASPESAVWASDPGAYGRSADVQMASDAVQVTPTGGSQPVDNLQPYLAINFIIATTGVFPSRS